MITIDQVNEIRRQFELAKLAFINNSSDSSDSYFKFKSVETLISSYITVLETGECENVIDAVIKAEVYSMMIELYFYMGIFFMRTREYIRAIKILNDCILLVSTVEGIGNEILGIRARIALELAAIYLEHGDDVGIFSGGTNWSCAKNRIIFHSIRNEINNIIERAKHLFSKSDAEHLGLGVMISEFKYLENVIKLF